MRPLSHSSGPRSNSYSESKFTNWTVYDPFFTEARTALKRFGGRIPEVPTFPHVIVLRPQLSDFIHACSREQVVWRLEKMPAASLQGLRAVFLLAGTRKQERLWQNRFGCYGLYLRPWVFLCAHPFFLGYSDRDALRDFYLDDVLVHEIAHHVDRERMANKKTKEAFAHAYVQRVSSFAKGKLKRRS